MVVGVEMVLLGPVHFQDDSSAGHPLDRVVVGIDSEQIDLSDPHVGSELNCSVGDRRIAQRLVRSTAVSCKRESGSGRW